MILKNLLRKHTNIEKTMYGICIIVKSNAYKVNYNDLPQDMKFN